MKSAQHPVIRRRGSRFLIPAFLAAATVVAAVPPVSNFNEAYGNGVPPRRAARPDAKSVADLKTEATQLLKENNYTEALEKSEEILKRSDATEADRLEAIYILIRGYDKDNLRYEFAERLEALLREYPTSWRVKTIVAYGYRRIPKSGVLVDGKFQSPNPVLTITDPDGSRSQNTQTLYSEEKRAHIRSLQILNDALPLVRKENAANKKKVNAPQNSKLVPGSQENWTIKFYDEFISFLAAGPELDSTGPFFTYEDYLNSVHTRVYGKIQPESNWEILSDLQNLHDYELQSQNIGRQAQALTADANGAPLLFHEPASFEKASNDGERVQALRAELFKAAPSARAKLLETRADEARRLLSPSWSSVVIRALESGNAEVPPAVKTLETLSDDESFVLVNGEMRKITLPDDFNFFKLWRKSLEYEENATVLLKIAGTYEERRQFTQEADALRQALIILSKSSAPDSADEAVRCASKLSQLEDPRAAFVPLQSGFAGDKTTLALLSRNADSARLVVRKVKIDRILAQIEDSDDPRTYESATLLARLKACFAEGVTTSPELVGEEVASFDVPINVPNGSFSTVSTVELPELPAGPYLVECFPNNSGNKNADDALLVWTSDVTIVYRSVQGGTRVFVLDARSGAPRAETPVRFLRTIFKAKDANATGSAKSAKNVQPSVASETAVTDENGSVFLANSDDNRMPLGTLVVMNKDADAGEIPCAVVDLMPRAQTEPQNMTAMGQGIIRVTSHTRVEQTSGTEVFIVADKPVYRPGETAQFKVWLRTPDGNPTNAASAKTKGRFSYRLVTAQGFPVAELLPNAGSGVSGALPATRPIVGKITPDEFGAFDGSFHIPAGGANSYKLLVCDQSGPVQTIVATLPVPVVGAANAPTKRLLHSEPAAAAPDSDALVVTPEKAEYKSGETARFKVTSTQKDAVVVLFPHVQENNAPNTPQILRLTDGQGTVEIPVTDDDFPNFSVEAAAVVGGVAAATLGGVDVVKANPELNVTVTPEKSRVAPGATTKLTIRLADAANAPVAGQGAVAVYDARLDVNPKGESPASLDRITDGPRRATVAGFVSNRLRYLQIPGTSPRLRRIGLFGDESEATLPPDEYFVMGVVDHSNDGGKNEMVYLPCSDTSSGSAAGVVVPADAVADVVYWNPTLAATDAGIVEVEFTAPSIPGTYKVVVWAADKGTNLGGATASVEVASGEN